MVSTITTLGTPHNGTPAADKLGSTKFIKDTINRIGKIGGTKALDLELGFLNGASNKNLMNHMLNMQNV